MQKHPLKPGGSHMDRLMLSHFQWLEVILHNDMLAIEVGVEFLQTKAYQETHSQCSHSKSQLQ